MLITIYTFYHFTALDDYRQFQQPLQDLMAAHSVLGTLLLAPEGINGAIAGSEDAVTRIIDFLKQDARFQNLHGKRSRTSSPPFHRAKVKLKKEIVTMGVANINPATTTGTYVKPENWNALIADPETQVIDIRNDYEVRVGTFQHAIPAGTQTFREFPAWARKHLESQKHGKIAMFCTGGIRCEKSTAYLKSSGFDKVYQLQGGILNYLATVPENESLWKGECFVFDDRVTVNHRLEPGNYAQCHACRRPVSIADQASPAYQPGVSCPWCIHEHTDERRARFAEREQQVQLALARGVEHLGPLAQPKTAQSGNRSPATTGPSE